MTDFNGRTVLVTGASGRIGGTTVRHLIAKGAHVIASGRSVEALESLAVETGAREAAMAGLVHNSPFGDAAGGRRGRQPSPQAVVAEAARIETGALRPALDDARNAAVRVVCRWSHRIWGHADNYEQSSVSTRISGIRRP